MPLVEFLAGVLAVWRISHLVVEEDGPFNLCRHLRGVMRRIGLARLFGCFLCFSIWAAVPIALLVGSGWREVVLFIPALSGGAILLERATQSAWFDETR